MEEAGEQAGWENAAAMEVMRGEESALLCRLFEDLLAFYELDYTLNVLKNEVNDDGQRDVSAMLRRLGLDSNDRGRPLLFQLLESREQRGAAPAEQRKALRASVASEEDDVFMRESCAMDMSVDSDFEMQFDHIEPAESVL